MPKPISIQQVEIYQSRIPLKEPFVISLGPLYYAENVIIVLRTQEGISGFGECSPFQTIHGESIDTAAVVARYLGKALLGKNVLDLAGCSMLMDLVIYGNACIKSAFDMALYDIASSHAGLPLFAFLGGDANKKMYTDYTVSFGDPVKMALDALKIKQRGFTVIKVKLGGDLPTDLERIRFIREHVGMEIPIRIDANQGWDPVTAVDILKRLAVYEIEHCEEPVLRSRFMELPHLRKESPIPLMADESCWDDTDAQRLLDLEACDRINIKLGKSSGIYKAEKIIKLAESKNIPMQMGGFLESRLGFTAAAHVALVSDFIRYFDFDTPLMFEYDPVTDGISYSSQGAITVPVKPGLGASVEASYLKGLTMEVIR